MPFLPNFTLHRLSFWIGFIAASLLWWLLFKLRPQIPIVKKLIQDRIQAYRDKQRAGIEAYLREYIYNQFQSAHLLHQIFPLSSLLIPPQLTAIPIVHEPGEPPRTQTASSQMLPYLPDWSEWLAEYPAARTTLLDLVQSPQRLVIIAEPGQGKSTALVHAALVLAKEDPQTLAEKKPLFPFVQHVLDWDFLSANDHPDPLASLSRTFQKTFPNRVQKQLSRLFQQLLADNRLLLLLDGFDELAEDQQQQLLRYLKALTNAAPELRIVLTASTYDANGLIQLGFTPVGLAAWNQNQRATLIEKFTNAWVNQVQPAGNEQAPTPLLVNQWVQINNRCLSPFEITLLLWGAYSGRLAGREVPQALQAWLDQLDPRVCPPAAISALAFELIFTHKSALSYDEVSRFLSRFKGLESDAEDLSTQKKKKARKIKVSSVDRALDEWMAVGILVEHENGIIRFSNPVVLGYLASRALEQQPVALRVPSSQNSAQRYYTASTLGAIPGSEVWLAEILQKDEVPLFANTFVAARWLHLAPLTSVWRSAIMRKLLSMVHDDHLPFGIRSRAAAAIINANEPSAPALFTQLLNANSPVIRQIAVISLGALKQDNILNQLSKMQNDADIPVQVSVCLALGALTSAAAIEQLVNTLMQGDEIVRQAAAEALSIKLPDGLEILKQAARYDDLLVRCAVISGLTEVIDPDVDRLLENLATEDAQWMVRKTAGEALVNRKESHSGNVTSTRPLHEISWLIKYASKLGQGIPAQEVPLPLILTALQKGTFEEKIAALDLLKSFTEPDVLAAIKETAIQTSGPLQEAAIAALWQIHQN